MKRSRKVTPQIKCKFTCRRLMYINLRKVLTYRDRLSPLNPHERLITWLTWCHVMIWKVFIPTLTWLTATKLGSVLAYGRRFNTQTLKSSPTFCLMLQCHLCVSLRGKIQLCAKSVCILFISLVRLLKT